MSTPLLHYVYDPLCGWCYAAVPMVEAVSASGIAMSLHGGGLWSSPTKLSAEKGAHIRANDARIATMTGQHFGDAYIKGLLSDPQTVFWSLPTVAAVRAVGAARPGSDGQMLHAIQFAHYVEGRRVVERETLADLAAGIGVESAAFEKYFDLDQAAEHIERSREFMKLLGIHGFPGFALEVGGDVIRVPHDGYYARPTAFVDKINRVVRQKAA